MPLNLRYVMREAGWADAWISNGSEEVQATVEWDHDSLGDMVRIACFHLEGHPESAMYPTDFSPRITFFTWHDGSHAVEFKIPYDEEIDTEEDRQRFRQRELHGRVLRKAADEADERELFTFTTTVGEYAAEVRRIADEILAEYGFRGYAEEWVQSDYPLTWYARLLMLLGETTLTVPLTSSSTPRGLSA